MWKEYTKGYLKNNRTSAVSMMTASFISALLLSLLSATFYNLWKYEVERLTAKGDTYALQAMYLVRDANDTAPRLVFPLFLLIMGLASVSLVIIIHNVFTVSMNARLHQFGIFSSIGATPKQIRTCLFQEAWSVCAVPVLAGTLLGIAGAFGITKWSNVIGAGIENRREEVFGYHPLILAVTLLIAGVTIGVSVWLPARKLSRMTPLEAIKNAGDGQLKRRKHSRMLSLLFGVEGELAGNALKAQKKALRTASLSLFLSFMAFTLMQCFFSLSAISTRETYFEKYQDAWDIMVTVKDEEIGAFGETEKIRALSGAKDVVVYQKAAAKCKLSEEKLSEEMKANGGFSRASEKDVTQTEDGMIVNAPIVILDDESFLRYCAQIGIEQRLDGAVILNRIRDVTNPDFRHPQYMPYLKEGGETVFLGSGGMENVEAENGVTKDAVVELPVLAYTQEVPRLREEYATLDYYELVHFLPLSLWKEYREQIAGTEEEDTCIRVLGREGVTVEELSALQQEIDKVTEGHYKIESENRIRSYEENDTKMQGMMTIFGGFCVLLAVIGVSNMFSNTLGFVRQRKREIARYLSVGMKPQEIRKMFCIEAFVIVGKPVLFTLPVVVLAVGAMLRASFMDPAEFMAEAPLRPIITFMLAVWAAVGFSYYLGWRKVRGLNLTEVLRDDTMV
ncbi:MAG: ABC transporter permease [Lachnospiraceae bacterium]|nr:ABC transporter permease [Lachnospiraceae bacterium]